MEDTSTIKKKTTEGKKSGSAAPCEQYVSWRLIPHVYHAVVVGCVKSSICIELEGIDYDLIRRQHESLVRILRELNLRVIEVFNLNCSYQSNLLLEHMAVSCHGIVYLPKPRTEAEAYNVGVLKGILKTDCAQVVVPQRNRNAKVCGADVLFTGVEVIVGLSETTNEAGANELAEVFTDFPVTAIKMPNGADHIKNYVTVAGEMILAVGPSDLAKDILDKIMRSASLSYNILEVAEDEAANCLYINQTLIHQAIEEIPDSFKIFIEKSRNTRRSICFSEFSRLRGGLTSVCILTKQLI